jgi:hypothetical protein
MVSVTSYFCQLWLGCAVNCSLVPQLRWYLKGELRSEVKSWQAPVQVMRDRALTPRKYGGSGQQSGGKEGRKEEKERRFGFLSPACHTTVNNRASIFSVTPHVTPHCDWFQRLQAGEGGKA